MTLVDRLGTRFPIVGEASIHPHCPEERADLFHAIDPGSAELEVLELLHALIRLYKPMNVLETGTGHGFTAVTLASALQSNGAGHLHTVELDQGAIEVAEQNLQKVQPSLSSWLTCHHASSLEFIEQWPGPQFDFALFDSLIAFRHLEFEKLLSRDLLKKGAVCCFHDTSRLRGKTMHDYNPDMIAALDRHSQGRQWLECEFSRGFRLLRV